MFLLLYPFLFLILIFKYYKWRHITPLTLIIVFVYFFSSVTANYLYFSDFLDYNKINISFHSVIFLFLCLSILISGFFKIEKGLSRDTKPLSFWKIKYFILFIIIISFISIISSIMSYNSLSNMDIGDIRFNYNQQTLYKTINSTILGYFVLFGNLFYVVSIFLFNYIFKYYPRKKLIIILLLISSTTVIFSNLTIAGRDGIVLWILMLIGNFFLFSNKLAKSQKKQYIMIVSLFLMPVIYIFIYTTAGRFGGEQSNIIDNILDYFGQSFINFSKIFDLFPNGTYFGKMTFPVFFPYSETISIANLNQTFTDTNFNLNVFSTLIGSFYIDFGYLGTLVVTVLIYFLFRFIAYINVNSIIYTILTLYIFQVVIMGLFYFMNYSQPFQKYLGLIILTVIFRKYYFANNDK